MDTIIKISIIISYCIIGAYATTDITRLLKGSTKSVVASGCYCGFCDHKLIPSDQIPLLSYIFRKRKCPYCNTDIPVSEFIFEATFLVLPVTVCYFINFSFTAFLINLALYEIIKFIMIVIKGHRESEFSSNLIKSLLINCVVFSGQFVIFLMLRIYVSQ